MSYSIKPILHHATGKDGLRKLQMLIIYKRMKFTLPTNYKVKEDQFENGRCKGFAAANNINSNLVALKDKYEKLLLSVIEDDPDKETLKLLFTKPETVTFKTFYHYTLNLVGRLTLSEGRLKHYRTLATQIKDFGDFSLAAVSPKMALSFEKYLRGLGLEQNTINSKFNIFIAIVNHAISEKLIKDDCLKGYRRPRYVQTIPDYLTEEEIDKFKAVVDSSTPQRYKTAGYYFLLSCYTGYRISDLAKFDYDKAVRNGLITIRATKNLNIVAIPVYPKLAEILEQVRHIPFYFTHESMRKYVKEIAMLAGLNRKIKVHTARHTFAIMLMQKGFTVDEVARLLGDSVNVAKIYARVTDLQLHRNVKERLG